MLFISEDPNVAIKEGAVFYLDPLDLALVDVLVQLHFGAHGQLPQLPVSAQSRVNLISQVLLSAGRSLAGWPSSVLLAHAEAIRSDPAEAAQAIAKHAYQYLRRNFASQPEGKPASSAADSWPRASSPPAAAPVPSPDVPSSPGSSPDGASLIFRASVVLGTLELMDGAALRAAASSDGLGPAFRSRLLALAAFRESLQG